MLLEVVINPQEYKPSFVRLPANWSYVIVGQEDF